MNSYRWSVVTVKSIVTVPVKKACKSAKVCSCSSFISITMPHIMIDPGLLLRLIPRWIHTPRLDSYPIGQGCTDTSKGHSLLRPLHQHLPIPVALHRRHQPGLFHLLDQPRCAVVADPELALHRRDPVSYTHL